jgi:hypothetical protein
MTKAINSISPPAIIRVKAAEDSRTPGRWRVFEHAVPSARSWSAAVLCRFVLAFSDMENFDYGIE